MGGLKGLYLSDCRILGSGEGGRGGAAQGVRPDQRLREIGDNRKGGLFSEDAAGFAIAHNQVRDSGDNGILVWRSAVGESLRRTGIAAKSGGGRTAMASTCFALAPC